ncbi:MFS transporter [Saccharothrix sp. BKS2]|uniref:MFS transporter n=1 Tax=Saccharothrix sp. BKS2 TaxID=3064400 RepID=UPI0039E9CB79
MAAVPSFVRHLIPDRGPIRVLAASNLARTVGNGVLISVTVLFFTRSVGIPATQVGLGMTIAAVLGMLVSIPAGRVADVLGARTAAIAFVALQGLTICTYALVGGFVGFVLASTLVISAQSAADAARGALVAGVTKGKDRVRARAYLRSITNIGVSIGAVAGGVALHFDSRPGYVSLLFAAGVLYVVAGLVFLKAPNVPPAAKSAEGDGPTWVVLRDRPFAVVALLNAVLVMNGGILTVALPIWIAERTEAPTWVYSAILLLNTIMVVLFQVRASQGSEDVEGGARALRRCGVLLAVCCGLFALAADQPAWLAVVALGLGALVHVFGELLYSAGSWALAYELAPEHAQGQYQGLFGMSTQLGSVITPVAATTLVIGFGWPGWLVFAVVLLAAGLAAPAVARWAQSTRPQQPAESALPA